MPTLPTDAQLVGGYFIIVYLSLILYGIVIAQTYTYALHAKDDPFILKLTVTVVGVLETVHMALMLHSTYLYSALDFGHPQLLPLIPVSAGASVMLGMVITACVQMFYIRRIYILSAKNWLLTTIVSVMLFVRVPFSFTAGALMYTLHTWNEFRVQIGPLVAVCVGLGLSAVVDITIASMLIYYLYKARTGFKSTDRLIHTLMAYTVNSGFITMICSTLAVVTFFVLPQSLVFAGLVQMSSKLYANSFLGTLNARQRLRTKSTSASTQRPSGNSGSAGSGKARHIEIFQETFKAATHDPTYSTMDRTMTYGTIVEDAEDRSFDKQPESPA